MTHLPDHCICFLVNCQEIFSAYPGLVAGGVRQKPGAVELCGLIISTQRQNENIPLLVALFLFLQHGPICPGRLEFIHSHIIYC